jgi:hypothetical protein
MPVNTRLTVKRIYSNSGLPQAFYPEKACHSPLIMGPVLE